jgi:tetraacyldisaccharide 4'-kinase
MPLSAGFKMGVALRRAAYQHGWLATRRLNRPVVSVGNLSVGGTGKTPFVEFLAGLLVKRGWKPGILTRGYGRRNGPAMIAIEPAANRAPDPREVGDEPALLARKLPDVPIVVSANRYRAGLLAEEKFNVDLHILDDGFQHFALARDVDIVLLDSTQSYSNQHLLPSGRLREPIKALGRAHMVILTRAELADPAPTEEQVRRINPKAEISRCTTKLKGLLNISSGALEKFSPIQSEPIHAFCGIGNPSAFFGDLEKWGYSVASRNAFPDHHVYQTQELDHLITCARESGAKQLITTEKDALNLPHMNKTDIPILACVVQTEVCRETVFEETLLDHLKTARVNA